MKNISKSFLVTVVILVLCCGIIAVAAILKYPSQDVGVYRAAVPPLGLEEPSEEKRSHNLPRYLHLDSSSSDTSKLGIGYIYLSYGYLFANPESEYTQAITTLSKMVADDDNDLIVNFRIAELAGYDRSTMVGAACAFEQGEQSFYQYHYAVLGSEAPLQREAVFELATELSLDMEQFRDCFADVVQREYMIIEDWDPANISESEMLKKVWSYGEPLEYDDFCAEAPGLVRISDLVPCINSMLAIIEQHGSWDNYVEHKVRQITISDDWPQMGHGGAVVVQTQYGSGQQTISYFTAEYESTDLMEFHGYRNGQFAASLLNNETVYIAQGWLNRLTTVSLLDGSRSETYFPAEFINAQRESIKAIKIIDDEMLFVICDDGYVPEGCRFTIYDHQNNTVISAVDFDAGLSLYEGLWLCDWDGTNRIANICYRGGDAGTATGGEYELDALTGEKIVVEDFPGVYSGCVHGGPDGAGCTGEEAENARRYASWLGSWTEGPDIRDCINVSADEFLRTRFRNFLGCY